MIVAFELGAAVDPDEFRRAGLRVVDTTDRRIVIAFADDPQLAAFYERLDALAGETPAGQKNEPHASFFDAIDNIRPLGPADRITDDVRVALGTAPPDRELRLDVECWHPGDAERAIAWLSELRTAVSAAGGRYVDSIVNDGVGLVLARIYVRADRVMDLAELDVIARIDILPTPLLSTNQLFGTTVADIPEVLPPIDTAPVVGLVDSGVASAHELLSGAIVASEAIGAGISDDQDENGHGTMVASMLLHGDIATALTRGVPLRPICRIASARVLDSLARFSDEDLWENDLGQAITWCIEQGASIINLSIGDGRSPFQPPRQMTAAAIVDDLARRHGLVVVVSAGNTHPRDYLGTIDDSTATTYPASMLASQITKIIDPATSMLAITVGGITSAAAAGGISGTESVRRVPMGRPGWPSPITRLGPGLSGVVKPEVVHLSGTLGLENRQLVSHDAELGVIGARAASGRLLSWGVGTSYAVPAVTRIAAAIRSRFPDFSAEMVRSLILLSAERLPFDNELEGSPAARREGERNLVGYGKPSTARAIESTSHRAVLVASDTIPINGVHIYEVPVPQSFMDSGGTRGIDIALAFSPRTRIRRLDYMATRMEFHLVKGLELDEVADVFADLAGEELDDDVANSGEVDGPFDEELDTPIARLKQSELKSRLVELQPTVQIRSRGANQLARRVFSQRLQSERDTPMFLVVRNINRWEDETATETYAISLALSRDPEHAELHAELEARLEAVVELEVDIEIEV